MDTLRRLLMGQPQQQQRQEQPPAQPAAERREPQAAPPPPPQAEPGAQPQAPPAEQERPRAVMLNGGNRVPVVEQRYQDALRAIAGGQPGERHVTAELVREPSPDGDAVAVRIDGQTVGRLSRTDASAYAPVLQQLEQRGQTGTCRATITDAVQQGRLDVVLDLAPPDRALA